jgi:hypothetical protein
MPEAGRAVPVCVTRAQMRDYRQFTSTVKYCRICCILLDGRIKTFGQYVGGLAMWARIVYLVCLLLILFLPTGCSNEQDAQPSAPTKSDAVDVTGEVTFIYDNVAADGGVTIDIELDDGNTERLLFSPFYWGDDSEERWDLYSRIQEVELGNRVKAVGQRTVRGIELEDLTILNR